MSAFSVVQSTAGTVSSTTTATGTLPNGVANGNSIILHVSYFGTAILNNLADNQGNTYLLQGTIEQANGVSSAIYLSVNVNGSTGASSFVVTATGQSAFTSCYVSVFEVTGLSGYPSNDGASQGTGASGTTLNVGSVTTQNANDVVICAARATSGTLTAGSGYTLVAGTLLEYKVVSSAGSNSGTLTNSASAAYAGNMVALPLGIQTGFNPWASGASGSAIEFVDTWGLSLGNIIEYERTQPWSVFASVKLLSLSGNVGSLIFSNVPFSGPAYPGYELWIDTTGKLRVRIISNIGTPNYIGLIGPTNIVDSTWHHVAATYDGSSTAAGVDIYLDGVSQTLTVESDTLSASIVASGQSIILGNQQGRNSQFGLRGYLDNFSIHNTVRNSAYVSAAAASKNVIAVDSNVQLYYNFDEGAGNVIHDASSNNFNVTIPNALPVTSSSPLSTLLV